jgi:hypothetical protein
VPKGGEGGVQVIQGWVGEGLLKPVSESIGGWNLRFGSYFRFCEGLNGILVSNMPHYAGFWLGFILYNQIYSVKFSNCHTCQKIKILVKHMSTNMSLMFHCIV